MDARPTTIEFRGTTPTRFGAGCAAYGANGTVTSVRFAGAKLKFSLGSSLVAHAVGAGAFTFTLATSRDVLAMIAAAFIVLVFVTESMKRREASLEVPLCGRCASDVTAIRSADRTFIAVLVICASLALAVIACFAPAPWVNDVFHACVVAVVLVVGWRVWRATKESDRFEVESRVGAVRFQFADAEAARRFEAENPAETVCVELR